MIVYTPGATATQEHHIGRRPALCYALLVYLMALQPQDPAEVSDLGFAVAF